MAWRQESWAEIVARAATATPHARRTDAEHEDRAAIAARAEPWTFPIARLELRDGTFLVGTEMESVEIALAQLYHLEPVDPWPSLAIGWVDRGGAHKTVLTPREPGEDAESFAAKVDELVSAHAGRLAAVERGWLSIPVVAWEPVDALPGERDEGPAMRGYRMAPEAADPEIARRRTAPGAGSLFTWVWARLLPAPRRIDAEELVLTQRFLYARTRRGERVRVPIASHRTARRTPHGDTIHVFGRSTEILLVRQDGCPLAAALEERVTVVEDPAR